MANGLRLIVSAGLVVGGVATAAADPSTTGTEQVELDASELRPPGDVPIRTTIPRATATFAAESYGPWGGGIRLMGLSGVGALPGVNVGGEIAGFVRHHEVFGELAIGRWKPQETLVVSEGPERVELGLDVVSLRGGWASETMPLRAWVLAEVGELAGPKGMMPGVVARMVMGESPDHGWAALGGGFGVAWPMADHARLVGTVEFAVPVARTPIMMDAGQPFEPDAAAARCSFGLEVGWR